MSPSHHTNSTKGSVNPPLLCASPVDVTDIWQRIQGRARQIVEEERGLRVLLDDVVLSRGSLGEALGVRLARKLAREDMRREEVTPLISGILNAHPEIALQAGRDLLAIRGRDPACSSLLQPLLFFKGFMAISVHRVAHQLWHDGRRELAMYFQSLSSEVFGVDIHPAARIGCGIMLDHATSFVAGETSIIEDDVSILHEVTLGGTGNETGDRHPIIRSGVLLGAGAKILGRVVVGEHAKVGAGSVVLADVPPHCTVAGVPAAIVGMAADDSPALTMDQRLRCRGKKPG